MKESNTMIKTAKGVKVYELWADAYVRDCDGVVLWKSNDRSPFADVLRDFLAFGYISQVSFANTVIAKEEQNNAVLEDLFSRGNSKPSREQSFERNANRF
jgi:hypothetical protein